jgi:hypothetical protein
MNWNIRKFLLLRLQRAKAIAFPLSEAFSKGSLIDLQKGGSEYGYQRRKAKW